MRLSVGTRWTLRYSVAMLATVVILALLVYDRVERRIESQRLRETLTGLSRLEKKILELRYGLLDGVRQTQREISKLLGISRSYVSRIEKRAIHKLQERMLADG